MEQHYFLIVYEWEYNEKKLKNWFKMFSESSVTELPDNWNNKMRKNYKSQF